SLASVTQLASEISNNEPATFSELWAWLATHAPKLNGERLKARSDFTAWLTTVSPGAASRISEFAGKGMDVGRGKPFYFEELELPEPRASHDRWYAITVGDLIAQLTAWHAPLRVHVVKAWDPQVEVDLAPGQRLSEIRLEGD